MGSKQANVDFVLEQLGSLDDVSARKMFGEYAIYYDGTLVALFCDDQLFMKPTDGGRALLGKVRERPPYPGAKPYFLITGDRCEDADFLCELVTLTAKELPKPKPKAAKPKPKAAKAKPKAKAAAKKPRPRK